MNRVVSIGSCIAGLCQMFVVSCVRTFVALPSDHNALVSIFSGRLGLLERAHRPKMDVGAGTCHMKSWRKLLSWIPFNPFKTISASCARNLVADRARGNIRTLRKLKISFDSVGFARTLKKERSLSRELAMQGWKPRNSTSLISSKQHDSDRAIVGPYLICDVAETSPFPMGALLNV